MPVNLIRRSSPWPVRPGFGGGGHGGHGGGGGGALMRQGSIKHRRKASTTKNLLEVDVDNEFWTLRSLLNYTTIDHIFLNSISI